MLEILLVFLILIALMMTTIVLVIVELKKMKDAIAKEENASRQNEKKLKDDLNITTFALHSKIASEDSNILLQLETGDKKLSDELSFTKSSLTKTKADVLTLNSNISNYLELGSSNLELRANNLKLGQASSSNYGSAKYNSDMGISIENSANGSLSDLWVPRAQVGTSLNIGGSLSFSTAQETYLLGMGPSNLNLQLPINREFTVTGAQSNATLRVNERNTAINSSLNVTKDSTFMGGVSEHNSSKMHTHFPWAGNGRNYIRGDTEITGNTNNVGDMIIGRDLRVNRNAQSTGNINAGRDLIVNGATYFKGGVSEHNPGKSQTHFPWPGNGRNYIRGDTEITGNTNNVGDLRVGRQLCIQDVCISKSNLQKILSSTQ